jgi:methylmalonyl-CoA/ethylmalonyl-CoA epimerase
MSQPAGLGIARIGQISVTARDVERATAFYRDTLGLQHLFGASGMEFFLCGGVRLMISRPESPEFDHPSSILYFDVPDIAASHAALQGRGVAFVDEPHKIASVGSHDLWMAFFKDSEGNTLALMSHVPVS